MHQVTNERQRIQRFITGIFHSLYQSVGPQMDMYSLYAIVVDTVRFMKLEEIEENVSMKKRKQDFDGNSSSHGGSMGGSKPLSWGQYASALSASIQSSASVPRHKSESKGGQSFIQCGFSQMGHDKPMCLKCRKPHSRVCRT